MQSIQNSSSFTDHEKFITMFTKAWQSNKVLGFHSNLHLALIPLDCNAMLHWKNVPPYVYQYNIMLQGRSCRTTELLALTSYKCKFPTTTFNYNNSDEQPFAKTGIFFNNMTILTAQLQRGYKGCRTKIHSQEVLQRRHRVWDKQV